MRRQATKRTKHTQADARELRRMRDDANAVSGALKITQKSQAQAHTRPAEIYGVRRLIVAPNTIVASLTFDASSVLPQRGFYRNYPKKGRPLPNIMLLNAYMAKEIAKRRPDSPESYFNKLDALAHSMPTKISGELGAVCLEGAIDRPGLKNVGWYLTSPLQETLMGETQKIYDDFKVPLVPRQPYVMFAQTTSIEQAEAWQTELAGATPVSINITLDRARPYPIPT